jgi:hypothetical protein
MSVWLGLQLMAARWIMARPWPDLERVVRQTLLGTLAFACVVGSARVETIFLCYQYCAYKLAGQLGLAGGLFLWQTSLESPHPRLQKICRILGIVLLALGVLLAAVKFGSRNFKAGWLF